ncbi:UNVERIFIED_CONTAM: hypothetical protein K2H54_044673 [Gekko kuhli]
MDAGRRHHFHFLNALCGAHGKGGRAPLPFPKEAVALKVKEIMMDSFFSIEPKFLLAMRAGGELRTPCRKSRLQQHQSRLPLPWGQNMAKEPPARSKASTHPGDEGDSGSRSSPLLASQGLFRS